MRSITSLRLIKVVVLLDLLETGKMQVDRISPVSCDYEYLDDSDLEDEEFEDGGLPEDGESVEISDAASSRSAPDPDSHESISVEDLCEASLTTPLSSKFVATTKTQQRSAREVVWAPFGAVRT